MARTPLTDYRRDLWLAHITEHADEDGIWETSPERRQDLPTAEHLSEGQRHRLLQQMADDGYLERVSHGKYRVAEKVSVS